MSRLPFDAIRRQIQQLAGPAVVASLSDWQLLERFAQERDETAFADLLRRHGPLVRGVCRRVLHHAQDAEDAFQATFLVLARRAAAVRWHDSVGNWLYCVAYRLALKVRRAAEQRQALAEAAGDGSRAPAPPDTDLAELCAVVDQEVLRLPEKYRIPVLRCYLEGQTRDQAARQLGWSLRTLERRLEQGRELLRARLTARGVTLTAALLAAEWGRTEASAAVSTGVVEATVRAAHLFMEGKGSSGGVPLAKPAILAEGVLQTMFLAKLKWAAALALTACLLAAGVGLWAQQPGEGPDAPQAVEPQLTAPEPERPPADVAPPRLDLHGDPLPPGALARLGDARFRHGCSVLSVAFSPDAETLASYGRDGTVRLWEAATGKEIRSGKEICSNGPGLALLADGKILVLRGKHSEIVLWEAATLREILAKKSTYLLSPDGKTLASNRSLIEVATGKEISTFKWAEVVAFSPDGKTLASKRSLIEVATGKEISTFKWSWSLAFAPDGKTLASLDLGRIVLWEAATGKEIRTWTAPQETHGPCAFSPDGKILATQVLRINRAGEITLWEAATAKRISSVTGVGLAFSPNGKTLATWGMYDDPIWLWDVATGKKIHSLTGPQGHWVFSLAFSPDGKTLASGGHEGAIRRWEVATGKEIAMSGHQQAVRAVTFSPDGKTLASGSWDKTIRLWEPDTGKEIRSLTGHQGSVNAVAFSPDGKTLASGGNRGRTPGYDNTIRLWEAATGKEIRILSGRQGDIDSVAFSPDGKTLASDAIGLWDLATGKEIRILPGGLVRAVAFSPDGKTLASGGCSALSTQASLWAVATGEKIRTLDPKEVQAVAFSPDGKLLASAGEMGFTLSEPDTGKKIRILVGHDGAVTSVAFSPDGKTLASASVDKTVRLWDVVSGKEIRAFAGHRGPVRSVAYAPDGKTLASASDDATILVWDLFDAGGQRPPAALSPRDLQGLWNQLVSDDAPRASQAVGTLIHAPRQSVPFLRERVQPVAAPAAERLKQLLADLESNQFAIREKASADLQDLGESAAPALRAVLEGTPALETRRRVEALLEKVEKIATWSGERLRVWRVIQVLEGIGTPEAQAVLHKLAEGAPASRLTAEAKASAQRLAKRAAAAP